MTIKIWYNTFISLCLFSSLALAQKKSIKKDNAINRPNIILLLTDDQRYDALGAMGNPIIQTPNIDKLAAKGILFKNAYVTTAICMISRASLLTGQYESRHKINDFKTDLNPQAVKNTYPILLKNAGYKIGFIGKYGVGENPPKQYFDYWSAEDKGQPKYILKDANGNTVHHTDSVNRDVKKFMDQLGNKGPFCLSVSFKAPHEQDGKDRDFIIQPRYKNLYKDIKIPVPETADPKYWNSLPGFFKTDKNVGRQRWNTFFSTPDLFQESVKNYYRLVTGVDEVVGNLIETLKKSGQDKNTVIIYMGDNGFLLGEHGLEGKWYGYEESIRVPLIIYDPRKGKSGMKADQMVLNIDIAPTILTLAGIKVPAGMQGKDLFAFIDRKIPEREDFFYERTDSKSPQMPRVEGVVTRDFKYMKYIEHGYEELYSIKTDPHETTNLASDPKYAGKLETLKNRYKQLKKEVL